MSPTPTTGRSSALTNVAARYALTPNAVYQRIRKGYKGNLDNEEQVEAALKESLARTAARESGSMPRKRKGSAKYQRPNNTLVARVGQALYPRGSADWATQKVRVKLHDAKLHKSEWNNAAKVIGALEKLGIQLPARIKQLANASNGHDPTEPTQELVSVESPAPTAAQLPATIGGIPLQEYIQIVREGVHLLEQAEKTHAEEYRQKQRNRTSPPELMAFLALHRMRRLID